MDEANFYLKHVSSVVEVPCALKENSNGEMLRSSIIIIEVFFFFFFTHVCQRKTQNQLYTSSTAEIYIYAS